MRLSARLPPYGRFRSLAPRRGALKTPNAKLSQFFSVRFDATDRKKGKAAHAAPLRGLEKEKQKFLEHRVVLIFRKWLF